MHERQIISILQSRIWRLGDKKWDKYIFCLLYVAQKGLEQSWEWTPQHLMSRDNLVVTVISKSTDIQTRREYKTRYSLIYFIIFLNQGFVGWIWHYASDLDTASDLQRCTLNMSSWCCLSGLAVYLVFLSPSTRPYPHGDGGWIWRIAAVILSIIFTMWSLVAWRLGAAVGVTNHMGLCVCDAWKGISVWFIHQRQHTLTHIHLNEPPLYFLLYQMQLLTSNLESRLSKANKCWKHPC